MDHAAPVQQHTPSQQFWRDAAKGRWAGDVVSGTHATAHHVKVHSDGTVDVVRLDQDGTDWIDLGGSGARDFAAGRS
jgi:hypothetical protein